MSDFDNQKKFLVNVRRIRGLMGENNQNINDLALILNIHRNTLSLKLKSKREFTASEIVKIAKHFDVEASIFLS